MGTKGVITADIVGSTGIRDDLRSSLLDLIQHTAEELQKVCHFKIEMFRGDSFQILTDNAEKAPLLAILFRAGLRKSDLMSGDSLLDARMAVGIGGVEYESRKLALSNGEAFILSGHEFDKLGKRRLAVVTPSADVNDEIMVETAFVDDVVSHWTKQQSECMYMALLTNACQEQLAADNMTTRQNVAKMLSAAKARLVRMYLKRLSYLICEKL